MGGTQDPNAAQQGPMTGSNPAPPAATAGPNTLDNLVATMGLGQLLVVGGALVLLGMDIVLGWLARQFYIGDVVWLGAAIVVLGFALNRWMSARLPFAYQTLLMVGALIIAIVGVRGIVLDLISLLSSPGSWDAIELVGLLLYAAAVVATAWGAWLLMRGRR